MKNNIERIKRQHKLGSSLGLFSIARRLRRMADKRIVASRNIAKPATIDITPNWETTARMLIAILEGSSTTESVEFAKSEIIRMGKIIDQQGATK